MMKRKPSTILSGVIFSVIGLFFLMGAWYAYLDLTEIQKYDGTATGIILNKYSQTGADGGANYYLTYSFAPAGGNQIASNGRMNKQQWESVKEGDQLQIKYRMADPSKNIPLQNDGSSIIYIFLILILSLVFIIFGILRMIRGFKVPFKT